MTKHWPDDLAAFKHEPADYEQPVEAVTVEHLKPCPNPWCNSGVRPMPFAMRTGGFTVICGCDFHGPNRDTRAEAITAWNTRTQANEAMREALERIRQISSKPTYPGNNLRDIDDIARNALSGDAERSQANEAMREALEAAASLLPAKACDRHGITAAISLARGETSHD